ncbi:unnamed protein product, partial [Pylaiella littoralis]
ARCLSRGGTRNTPTGRQLAAINRASSCLNYYYYSRQPGRAGSPEGEGGKYDNVPYVLARTIRSNLHQEAAKLIGCTGMGNQCKRGQSFARAMQMFPGKGMDRIPTEVVLALLRH